MASLLAVDVMALVVHSLRAAHSGLGMAICLAHNGLVCTFPACLQLQHAFCLQSASAQ